MQAKLLFLFVLVACSIVACTEGAPPIGQAPMGRKREFEKFQRDTAGICRACMQLNSHGLEEEGMKEMPGYNR